MLDIGQYGSDFVYVPDETQLPADSQYFLSQEER
jgi:hypothetical protein